MNIRHLLIALMLLSNAYLTAMNLGKKGTLEVNIFEYLNNVPQENILEQTSKETYVEKKATLNFKTSDSEQKKIPNQTSLSKKNSNPIAKKTSNKFTNKVTIITNELYLPEKYLPACEERFDKTILIDDRSNKMTLYLQLTDRKESEFIEYTASIDFWIKNVYSALQESKYTDRKNSQYIGNDKEKMIETIRIHRFSKLVDSHITDGTSFEKKDIHGNSIRVIVLPGKVKYDESKDEYNCDFEYFFDSEGKCFHRNMILDTKKYYLSRPDIATNSFSRIFRDSKLKNNQ